MAALASNSVVVESRPLLLLGKEELVGYVEARSVVKEWKCWAVAGRCYGRLPEVPSADHRPATNLARSAVLPARRVAASLAWNMETTLAATNLAAAETKSAALAQSLRFAAALQKTSDTDSNRRPASATSSARRASCPVRPSIRRVVATVHPDHKQA